MTQREWCEWAKQIERRLEALESGERKSFLDFLRDEFNEGRLLPTSPTKREKELLAA